MNKAGSAHVDRTASQVLADARTLTDPALRVAVERLPAPMRRVVAYHFGWSDEYGQPTEFTRGKAIRPALTLLSAQAVGGDTGDGVAAAVAVELAHDFSLLHDDVMDGDATRRHRPAAWTVFGVASAVLAGDALVTLAFDVLANSGPVAPQDGVRTLSAALLEMMAGQSTDIDFQQHENIGMSECVRMAGQKTGALMGCACALGALSGGGTPQQVECLEGFGERLGMAFQLTDDLLGIWGTPATTGKPVCSDLAHRKKSLPVAAALTSGTPAAYELAALYQLDRTLTNQEVTHAANLIEQAGSRAWAQAEADHQAKAALQALEQAHPVPGAAIRLHLLTDLVLRRDH